MSGRAASASLAASECAAILHLRSLGPAYTLSDTHTGTGTGRDTGTDIGTDACTGTGVGTDKGTDTGTGGCMGRGADACCIV